jgi:predicted HTH transcriptional regulator
MASFVDPLLRKLGEMIAQGRFENLESDTVEIKPVPFDGGSWDERYKSVNAFLNTRGGILILGIAEERQGTEKRYVFRDYQEHAEPKLRELAKQYTDRAGAKLDLSDCFPPFELKSFLNGRVAIVYVDELAADKKFCFYKRYAYKRVVTGDCKFSDAEIERQEEFKDEAVNARELQPVPDVFLDDLDLDRLNEYIQQLNRPVKIEAIKAGLEDARLFLERKAFIKNGHVTMLGMLVCGKHPGDRLGFRAQVHGYVDVPQEIARDKQDFCDNILQLMENSNAYVLRNIQVGISPALGGSMAPQYSEELLRETINNALAHRNYSIDKQVIITIKPGESVSITNPGAFRKHLLLETRNNPELLRIIPEAKPQNPKLADVLRVYRKWEGKGIGMATLVNLCLENRIDLPYYRLRQDDVTLVIQAGKLLDDNMEHLFASFDAYFENKLNGSSLTENQKLVLAYLIKSEKANLMRRHTILLTPDNNHYAELITLEKADLIQRHPENLSPYVLYMVDREFLRSEYTDELRELYGNAFDLLDSFDKEILHVVYRRAHYSKSQSSSAKQVSFSLWVKDDKSLADVKGFDAFYRKVRRRFNELERTHYVSALKSEKNYKIGYLPNAHFKNVGFLS